MSTNEFVGILFGLIGGLGLFLFGMQRMAEGLQKAAGDRLRQILEIVTSHPIIAVITGAITTILVQSSSTTTVMVVGFVNAGLMNLQQAIGTIMGANIGTTVTAQVVSFNIYELALPAIGLGFALQFLGRNKFQRYSGQGILGFGLLILGMATMSESLTPLREYPPFLQALVTFGQIPLSGILAGAVFTILVQSSSATTGLVIAFTLQNLIDLPAGLTLILGANLGTCITAQLAAVGASLAAKRAAMAHILFNLIGVVIFSLILRPFSSLVALTAESVTRQVANAHTFFNVANTILLFPFISTLERVVTRLVPGQEICLDRRPLYLDKRLLKSPGAVISATQEILRMAALAIEMLEESVQSFVKNDVKLIDSVTKREEVVNDLEKAITSYLAEASQASMTSKQSHHITALMHVVNDIERIADHATNITELAEAKIDHCLLLSEMAQQEVVTMYEEVHRIVTKSIQFLDEDNTELAKALIREDDIIDNMEKELRVNHIARLNKGDCHPEAGVLFLDFISNLERVADHANNIAEAVAGLLTDAESLS